MGIAPSTNEQSRFEWGDEHPFASCEPLNTPSLIGYCKKSYNTLWLVIIISHIRETGQPTNMYIYIQYIIKWDWWDRGIFDGSAIPIPKWKMAIATRSITIDQRDLAYQCWDKHVKLAKKVRMEMTQKWEWKPPLLWEFDPLNILEIPWHHEQKIASPQGALDHFTLWLWLT